MNDFSQATWKSQTGADLAVRIMETSKNSISGAKAVIHINHGMAEHSARYERFARALAAAGYHAIAHDHRGHGYTTADDAPLGTFSNKDGLQKALEDIHFVNFQIRRKYPEIPIVYFGHSMGAILGSNYCIHHSDTIDGAALWNFNVDGSVLVSVFSILLKIERALKGSDVPSLLAMKLTFEDWNKKFKPNRTDFDWLTRDEAEVDKYIADPLCGFPVSVGMWLNTIQCIQNGGSDSQLGKIRNDLPFHLLGGQSDPSSMYGKCLERLGARLGKLGNKDVTVRTLPDTRHETLNELNRDEATAAFVQWLDQRWG
ncbi:MAG: alpha/beta hydrolase [Salaquimonas sp.]